MMPIFFIFRNNWGNFVIADDLALYPINSLAVMVLAIWCSRRSKHPGVPILTICTSRYDSQRKYTQGLYPAAQNVLFNFLYHLEIRNVVK